MEGVLIGGFIGLTFLTPLFLLLRNSLEGERQQVMEKFMTTDLDPVSHLKMAYAKRQRDLEDLKTRSLAMSAELDAMRKRDVEITKMLEVLLKQGETNGIG